jgi:hypothetical protein
MTRISAIIIAIASLTQLAGGVNPGEQESPSISPTFQVHGAGTEEATRFEDAVALFTHNGLNLPDLDVYFLNDDTECGGHHGLFQTGFTPWRVLICSDLAFVLPHELAHAWEVANLSADGRIQYLEARGLTNWNDHNAAWGDRGVEDAAFIIQQNLTADQVSMKSSTWQERATAFELLTGLTSPLRDQEVSDSVS